MSFHDHRSATVNPTPVKNPTDARQGVTGHNVRYVLAGGLLAVVAAFAVVYVLWFA